MKVKIGILFIIVSCLLSSSVLADQFYGGLGINPESGQPDYIADGFMNINLAYERSFGAKKAPWRFTFTMTNFKNKDRDTNKIQSMIIGAEAMFVKTMKPGMVLIGAFGPGYFSSTSEASGRSSSGSTFGLLATGSFRYYLTKTVFLSGAYHYKNCAVPLDKNTGDGGYQGLFINVGAKF